MNIVICEDDIKYCEYLEGIINTHINERHSNSQIILTAQDASLVMNYVSNNPEITFYLLDIKLANNQSGLDIAAEIRKRDHMSPIIFITNYKEMMSFTYEYKLEALDYIVKESSDEVRRKVCECIDFVEERQKRGYTECLNIKNKKKNFSIPFHEICYIESIKSSHKLVLYYEHGMIMFYALLKELEIQLGEQFIRCHKSVIVNKDKIINIDKQNHILELKYGYHCAYSIKYKEFLKDE